MPLAIYTTRPQGVGGVAVPHVASTHTAHHFVRCLIHSGKLLEKINPL